ncbi:MAG: hypothetical protein HF981_25590 [Desulfobacteraceae bacterium]|nr:hypothetical protein [Desulfobacteraceae bacterium]MBC2753791.1 hypothetical protein [Desulfobacteraceae bacterium]
MAEVRYQVIFRGKTVPDMPIEDVKANLANLFKTNDVRINRLFSGQAVVLKKGLQQEEGERYRVLLERAGALCEVVPLAAAQSSPLAEAAATVAADASPKEPRPAPLSEKDHAATAPSLKQRTAAIKEKVQAVQAGELHQALGSIREKVQGIDTEDAGRTVAALWDRVVALKRNKMLWGLAGAAFIVVAVVVMLLSGDTPPMPIESRVFNAFAEQYQHEVQEADLAGAGTVVLIDLARDVIEDMGFDYERTLLLWLLKKDRVESNGGMAVYTQILVDPVAVAVAADLSGIVDRITPETRKILTVAASLPPGVTLLPIKMVKSCPATGNRLQHDDLLQVLRTHKVVFDASQPDLAIADAFFGLERAGYIKIHRRWEKDVQFSDIEILDLAAMTAVEENLEYLAKMEKHLFGDTPGLA